MNIQKDLEKLHIDTNSLKPAFKSLEGTRHIIQYKGIDRSISAGKKFLSNYVFTLSKTYEPTIKCFGVTNRCEDGKFILFIDYDKIYKELMYKNLKNLLKQFPEDLDVFYIAETEKPEVLHDGKIKGSWHVVNFIKHHKNKIDKFLKYCDCDPFFIKLPDKTAHKAHVLRVSEKFYEIDGEIIKEKPEFNEIYPQNAKLSNKECSFAHYYFFDRYWDIKLWLVHKFDNLKKIEIHKYLTPEKK